MAASKSLDSAQRKLRGKIAGQSARARRDPAIAAEVASLRRDFVAANLERAIRSAVTAEPPLTTEQVARLRSLLTPMGGAVC
ncbi:hypothetical protein ACFY03_20355 [Micromonospora chersina]|uniref:hypothetical protein n=1 Tax=Micromonospora chersina TaxID=47854 RepID=UPI0036D1A936